MSADGVRFSVIIPTFRRPDPLRRCIEGFRKLAHPSWELIVVNDGGDNSFNDIDDALKASVPVTLVDAPHGGPAHARNTGAKRARGALLAFTDDDCIPEPDWLDRFEDGFADPAVGALAGACINPWPDNAAAATWQMYLEFLREYFVDVRGNGLMTPSNNVAYRREVFFGVGGFDESFPLAAGEDLDLSYRIVQAGHRQLYHDAAKIWHFHRSTAKGYLRQQYRYGRGTWDINKRTYAIEHRPRFFGEFYLRLAQYLVRHRAGLGVWGLVALTPFAHRYGVEVERFGPRGKAARAERRAARAAGKD